MENELISFEFEEKQVRIIKFEGQIYFVGADLSNVLNYSKTEKCLALTKDKYKKHFSKNELENNISAPPNRGTSIFNNYGAIGVLEPGL